MGAGVQASRASLDDAAAQATPQDCPHGPKVSQKFSKKLDLRIILVMPALKQPKAKHNFVTFPNATGANK